MMAPRNGGSLEEPDLTGHAGTPGRGAFIILYLKAILAAAACAACERAIGEPLTGGHGWTRDWMGWNGRGQRGQARISHGLNTD